MVNTDTVIFSHIVATSTNHVIGLKGLLPWHIPEDLQFFKDKTNKKAIIMGRKTFESLKKPLPNRLNIIVSHFPKKLFKSLESHHYIDFKKADFENLRFLKDQKTPIVICPCLKTAQYLCRKKQVIDKYSNEIFIIGGGEIYKQSLCFVDYIYLTRIHQVYEGDVFYPEFSLKDFLEVDRKDCKGNPNFSFIIYKRKII